MTVTDAAPDSTVVRSHDPVTGEHLGALPVHDADAVAATVARARHAAAWWAALDTDERRRRLLAWKRIVARRADELCELACRETGKLAEEAMVEVILSCEHLDYAARNAKRVLARRRVAPGRFGRNQRCWVDYPPLGVVGAISPWNYPILLPATQVVSPLAAGNAVVQKPSEHTSLTGRWLSDTFALVTPEQPVYQAVFGFADTGAALCRAGVDKLVFTGSAATGRRVLAACAETTTPTLMELSGVDAVIVDDDADLDRAADATTFGAFFNAGQTCVAMERAFVAARVYEAFVDRLTELAGPLRAGADDGATYGAMTLPAQVEVVRAHVEDALARGARAVVGGLESVRPPFIDPIVLVDVPDDARVLHEETFGPVLAVVRVADVDEAVERTNALPANLNASVWGKRRAEEVAGRLRCGAVAINGMLSYYTAPALPFGGVGASGFGRLHGPKGLREFVNHQAVAKERFRLPLEAASYRRPQGLMARLGKLNRMLHGR